MQKGFFDPTIAIIVSYILIGVVAFIGFGLADNFLGSAGIKVEPGGVKVGGTVSEGTANRVLYIDSSGNLADSSNLAFNGTNFGVGTTSPGALLATGSGDILFDIGASGIFRIFNSAGGENEFVVDGSTGQIGLGALPDDDVGLLLDTPSLTITANTDYSRLLVKSSGVVAVTNATNSDKIATLRLEEPKIVEAGSGTVTNAATFLIDAAPTEGDNNYSLWVDAGATQLDGTLTVSGTGTSTSITSNAEILGSLGVLGSAGTATSTITTDLRISGKLELGGGFQTQNLQLTDGATVDVDWNTHTNYVTLGGNRIITFSNIEIGKSMCLFVIQDGTGSRTLTWPTYIDWNGGEPTLKTAAGATDLTCFKTATSTATVHGFY